MFVKWRLQSGVSVAVHGDADPLVFVRASFSGGGIGEFAVSVESVRDQEIAVAHVGAKQFLMGVRVSHFVVSGGDGVG